MSKGQNEVTIHINIYHKLLAVLPQVSAATLLHIPNGEDRSAITGAKLKRMGLKPGAEDLQFIFAGRLHAIEVKPEGKKQSQAQVDRAAAVVAAGGVYTVCRSIDDVRETLAEWGVPSREVRRDG